jgi:hypothetical protein
MGGCPCVPPASAEDCDWRAVPEAQARVTALVAEQKLTASSESSPLAVRTGSDGPEAHSCYKIPADWLQAPPRQCDLAIHLTSRQPS